MLRRKRLPQKFCYVLAGVQNEAGRRVLRRSNRRPKGKWIVVQHGRALRHDRLRQPSRNGFARQVLSRRADVEIAAEEHCVASTRALPCAVYLGNIKQHRVL